MAGLKAGAGWFKGCLKSVKTVLRWGRFWSLADELDLDQRAEVGGAGASEGTVTTHSEGESFTGHEPSKDGHRAVTMAGGHVEVSSIPRR